MDLIGLATWLRRLFLKKHQKITVTAWDSVLLVSQVSAVTWLWTLHVRHPALQIILLRLLWGYFINKKIILKWYKNFNKNIFLAIFLAPSCLQQQVSLNTKHTNCSNVKFSGSHKNWWNWVSAAFRKSMKHWLVL